jgi:hypothetical protein
VVNYDTDVVTVDVYVPAAASAGTAIDSPGVQSNLVEVKTGVNTNTAREDVKTPGLLVVTAPRLAAQAGAGLEPTEYVTFEFAIVSEPLVSVDIDAFTFTGVVELQKVM